MRKIYDKISEKVPEKGLNYFPTMDEVEEMTIGEVIRTHRRLPLPTNFEQSEIIEALLKRIRKAGPFLSRSASTTQLGYREDE